jgi:parallel beta-helix repeat protein
MSESKMKPVSAATPQLREPTFGMQLQTRAAHPARQLLRLCALAAVSLLAGSVSAIGQNAAQVLVVTPVTRPCTGERIFPGMTADAIQNLVDARPAGTTFCFASGTYLLNHYITLKDGNQAICPLRRTCVLTGLDQYRGAFDGEYGTSGQVVRGFVVEHFVATDDTWPLAGIQVRDNGLIEDNEVRFNDIGIEVGSNQVIRGNFIHHNRRYGLSGGPGDNILIDGNELSWNNTGQFDPNNDAGGSKIVGGEPGTHNLTWRANYVHHNYGNGIWTDGNVHNTLYERNVVDSNGGAGILHEISWDAVVRNNLLRGNNAFEQGMGKSCWHGAQIYLNNSQNVTITGNTIEAIATNAICAANSTRQESAVFPQALANITVSNNAIKMRGDVSIGAVGDTLPVNVVFNGNTYYVDNLASTHWTFMAPMTRAQWQAIGYDIAGQFLLW